MRKMLAICTLLCFSQVASSSDDIFSENYPLKLEEYLHNYGVSYCLSKAKAFTPEADVAMGGYFQLGRYSMAAQHQVEGFINQKLEERLGGYKVFPEPAYLMRCLEVTYSDEYKKLIRQQIKNDVLLAPVMPELAQNLNQNSVQKPEVAAATIAVVSEQKVTADAKAKKSKKVSQAKVAELQLEQGEVASSAAHLQATSTAVAAPETLVKIEAEQKAEAKVETKAESKVLAEQIPNTELVPAAEAELVSKKPKKDRKKNMQPEQTLVQEPSSAAQQEPNQPVVTAQTPVQNQIVEQKPVEMQAAETKAEQTQPAEKKEVAQDKAKQKDQTKAVVESTVVAVQPIPQEKSDAEYKQEQAPVVTADVKQEQNAKLEETQPPIKQKKQKNAKVAEPSPHVVPQPEAEKKPVTEQNVEHAKVSVEAKAESEQVSEQAAQAESASKKSEVDEQLNSKKSNKHAANNLQLLIF